MSRVVGIIICSVLIVVSVVGYLLYYLHNSGKIKIGIFDKLKKKPKGDGGKVETLEEVKAE